ncbi:ABC transporter ATP-binding protein [Arthrobacter sp. GMC3]|uniref:ABC transporter ATP-binding protein n=1 Tax=Arthrobacter sp. GMC3 TaxID=2058894 RepID=UPI000CE2FD39|nr:ABC transporter ATP-binding protein [Arthrobacter sp. GMC3]
MTETLLSVNDLSVTFDIDGTPQTVVPGISFDIAVNEVLAVVGESGSGKSVTAMALLGLLPRNATITGSATLHGTEMIGLSDTERKQRLGSSAAMIFQDPAAALNPLFSIGFQLAESVRSHTPGLSRAEAHQRVLELLALVEFPDPANKITNYPHQLSGGQCQRVVIAMALAGDPDLLIADEPTTALDVTVQAEILDVLRRMRNRLRSSILLITHDMGVVADIADRVIVMRQGAIMETAPVDELFHTPTHDYTRELLQAVPQIGKRPSAITTKARTSKEQGPNAPEPRPVLEVEDLVVEYRRRGRGFKAVDGVNLSIQPGEILAIVGESGSGKSTTALATIGLAPVTSGTVRILGKSFADSGHSELRSLRERIGVVFQNPATSLNPRFTVRNAVAEPLRIHRGMRGRGLYDVVDELLANVGLGGGWGERYPHELSGGQRQRVAIARAVALKPDVLIADEPTSALDVSVQARVLDVFRELQKELGFACLFISHDLAVVDSLSDRVAVMQQGRVVEQGSRSQVFGSPITDYTRQLLNAAPLPDPIAQRARRQARAS